jgi:CMP/dCMP kinase
MIIAIDGPASSGKGTAAQALAKKLKMAHLDSGSLYRVVAFYVFNTEIDPTNEAAVVKILPQIDVRIKSGPNGDRVFSGDRDITDEIRYHIVSGLAAQISKIPKVRDWVNKTVYKFTRGQNVVVEGRDMASEVFPEAEYKFYLDANLSERARRRHLELQKNDKTIGFAQVKKDLAARDKTDQTKEAGKLKILPDAIYIDSTNMDPAEVVAFMIAKIKSGSHSQSSQKV